jgi:hypothetical protein
MNREAYLPRTSFVLLGLLALVALLLLLTEAAPSLTGPANERPITAGEAAPDGVIVDPYAGIHPADRKFYNSAYGFSRSDTAKAFSLRNLHPADRKFFDPTYCWAAAGCSSGAGAGIAEREADRRTASATLGTPAAEADYAFYTERYWRMAAEREADLRAASAALGMPAAEGDYAFYTERYWRMAAERDQRR